MALSEKFCLRWNDFESNISDAFKDLREQKDFFDVTLACDDSQIEAHKVILSACSPFFRNILRKNPHQHPLLYIKGVKYKDLVSILNFMYMGEVNVVQEELNSFLVVAEELRVKGLTQNNPGNESPNKRNLIPASQQRQNIKPKELTEKEPVAKRPRTSQPAQPSQQFTKPLVSKEIASNIDDDNEIQEIEEVTPIKAEPNEPHLQNFVEVSHNEPQADFQSPAAQLTPSDMTIAVDEAFTVDESYNYEQYYDEGLEMANPNGGNDANRDLEMLINSKMTKLTKVARLPGESPNSWQCLECSYSSQMRCNVSAHIEAKHIQHEGYYCHLCNKTCPSKSAFRMHNKRNHDTPKA